MCGESYWVNICRRDNCLHGQMMRIYSGINGGNVGCGESGNDSLLCET